MKSLIIFQITFYKFDEDIGLNLLKWINIKTLIYDYFSQFSISKFLYLLSNNRYKNNLKNQNLKPNKKRKKF